MLRVENASFATLFLIRAEHEFCITVSLTGSAKMGIYTDTRILAVQWPVV